MSLLPKNERSPTVRALAAVLAAGVPFAAYVATASAHDYWLDSGELASAAIDLDIAHPPGHPLASLLGRALAYVPLGPLSFRVALAQALCAALASLALFSAIDTTVRSLGVRWDRLSIPVSLGATWLVSTSLAWWFSAVRPEVYALEALLVCVAIERVVALEADWPTQDVRKLHVAALALGLGLANHHFIAVLTLPAIAPTLARVYRARGLRPLLVSAAALAAGLAAYLYLPIRARTDPPVNLGDPSDLSRFWWVVSAQAYQSSHSIQSDPLALRVADVLVQLVDNLSVLPLVLAIAGSYALLRTPGARRIGYVWIALAGFSIAGRAWLGFVRSNPDALGYLMPALAGIAALAAALVGAVCSMLGGDGKRPPRRMLVALAVAIAVMGLAQLRRSEGDATLARFHATDELDELRMRSLPARAVVIAHSPQTVFRLWSVTATDRVRPDVTVLPVPFLAYPGMVEALVDRHPELADVIRGHLLEGELRQPDLQTLAARRPVLVELYTPPLVPLALYDTLAPLGAYYEVVDGGTASADITAAAASRREALARLTRALGEQASEPETRNQLGWIRYMDTLYFATVGASDAARDSAEAGLALMPQSEQLLGLRAALEGARGPIDVRPFLLGPPD